MDFIGFVGAIIALLLIIVILLIMKYWTIILPITLGVILLAGAIAIAYFAIRHKRLKNCRYTVIQEVDVYREELNPAWEYSNPDDQWLFAETVNVYVGKKYNVLYILNDGRYIEQRGLSDVPKKALRMARSDLDYETIKNQLNR